MTTWLVVFEEDVFISFKTQKQAWDYYKQHPSPHAFFIIGNSVSVDEMRKRFDKT